MRFSSAFSLEGLHVKCFIDEDPSQEVQSFEAYMIVNLSYESYDRVSAVP